MQTNFEHNWDERQIDMEDTKTETFHLKKPEMQNDRDRVYEAICHNGGTTTKELAEVWGCTPNEISGRFTELYQQGYIDKTDKKYLPNSKGKMYPHTIWRARL